MPKTKTRRGATRTMLPLDVPLFQQFFAHWKAKSAGLNDEDMWEKLGISKTIFQKIKNDRQRIFREDVVHKVTSFREQYLEEERKLQPKVMSPDIDIEKLVTLYAAANEMADENVRELTEQGHGAFGRLERDRLLKMALLAIEQGQTKVDPWNLGEKYLSRLNESERAEFRIRAEGFLKADRAQAVRLETGARLFEIKEDLRSWEYVQKLTPEKTLILSEKSRMVIMAAAYDATWRAEKAALENQGFPQPYVEKACQVAKGPMFCPTPLRKGLELLKQSSKTHLPIYVIQMEAILETDPRAKKDILSTLAYAPSFPLI